MFAFFSQVIFQVHQSAFKFYQAASTQLIFNISIVFLLGVGAQWVGWLFHIPSILILLVVGFLAGPGSGLVNPDLLLGELLTPIVSLSVAVILFEGGLNLKVSDLSHIGRVVRGLISIGVLATWTLATAFAHWLLPMHFDLCLLFGAILSLTGPTVILPLLRQIKPDPKVSAILKWEGILIDPVGATLAVLVFHVVLLGTFQNVPQMILTEFALVILWGTIVGCIGALILYLLFRFHLAPEYLHNPLTFALVLSIFAFSNQIQTESGLLAVTLAGILLGYQKTVAVRHILQFKENLQTLLISALFILLAARLHISDLKVFEPKLVLFLALLIFVIRPVSVWLSTVGTDLKGTERLFLAFLAPRGIVAASVASVFSLKLTHAGNAGAHLLVPYTFAVIVSTVCFYGLTAGILARYLGISQKNPQGTIILGAHDWAREIGVKLQSLGVPVLMIDRNPQNIAFASRDGVPVLEKSVHSDDISEEIELSSFRRILCLTSNDTVNSLAQMRFQEFFDRVDLFQLPLQDSTAIPLYLCGRFLFSPGCTFLEISRLYNHGSRFCIFSKHEWEELQSKVSGAHRSVHLPIPLFLWDEKSRLGIMCGFENIRPETGDKVLALCPAVEDSENKPGRENV